MLRLRADLHIHSTISDGRASPREIILVAIEKGLDAIAITDHNSFRGSVEALRFAKSYGYDVTVIIGSEIRTPHGDILVYCNHEPSVPNTLPELIDAAHEEGCLVVPAHPFDILRLGIGDAVFEYKGWDAIEVFNASANRGANKRAEQAAKLLGIPGIASSDAHIPECIGIAHTIIYAEDRDTDSILEAIRRGRVSIVKRYPPFSLVVKRIEWGIRRRILGILWGSSQGRRSLR